MDNGVIYLQPTLDDCLRRMQACVGETDREVSHSEADGILIEVLEAVAANLTDPASITIREIVKAWTEVGKWYA